MDADHGIVHSEACTHLHRVIHQIKDKGVQVGLAINPSKPLADGGEGLFYVDMVLVCTANPGFGGAATLVAGPAIFSKVELVEAAMKRFRSNVLWK